MTVSPSRRSQVGTRFLFVALRDRTGRRRDMLTAVGAAVFFAVVAVIGTVVEHTYGTLRAPWPPLLAEWLPHAGVGTPAVVVIAVAVVIRGSGYAERLAWRAIPWLAWVVGMAWTWSLALVDGWQRGVAGRLTTRYEYLGSVGRFDHLGAALRGFTDHIVGGQPGSWPPHVAGHPPGAILPFVALHRFGLDGGGWAGAFCIVTGSSVAAAALITLRALANERLARIAAPFLVLTPGAVWVGTSADAYFAAVAAWAIALLALAVSPRTRLPRLFALGSGLLFGLALYVSYGLALLILPALAVLVRARTLRPLPMLLAGLACFVVVFTLAGFSWWEAYPLLKVRYDQGSGGIRPYSYWLFGDLATVVAAAGPASVAGLRGPWSWHHACLGPSGPRGSRARSGSHCRASPAVQPHVGARCPVGFASRCGKGPGSRRRVGSSQVHAGPGLLLFPARDCCGGYVRDEQSGDGADLASLHPVVAGGRGPPAAFGPPGLARLAGPSRPADQPLAFHLLVICRDPPWMKQTTPASGDSVQGCRGRRRGNTTAGSHPSLIRQAQPQVPGEPRARFRARSGKDGGARGHLSRSTY